MKYSIKKSHHSHVLFTYENGVKAYRSTPVEKEFWARIQELESAIRKFLNYARTGNNVHSYVPNWQIEELATSLKSHQKPQPDLPHTNQDHFPPQSQELLPLDSRTEF